MLIFINPPNINKKERSGVLNVPNKREQSQTCLGYAERAEQSPQGNVPNLRFPEFSGEWEKKTLGDIGETFNGLTGKSGSDFGHGSPYITYKSIFDNSRVDLSRVEYVEITDAERKKKAQNEVQYGDVFFTTSSETPEEVGMSSVLLDEVEDCYLNSFCFGYRLSSLFDTLPEYMRFYLRSKTIRRKMFVLAQGSTRFNISKGEVMGMSINLPNAEEQRKIASLLTLLEDRIATQIKIIEDLKKLKSAITHSHFDAAIDKYNSVYIGECIAQVSQRNKDGKVKEVLSVSNKNGFVDQSEQFEDREIASEDTSNYKVVHTNDFAYNPARINVGSIARLHNYSCGIVSPMYICFHTKLMLLPEYFEHIFSTSYFRHEMHKRLEGSVRLCLTYDSLCNIKIALPSIDEQKQFASQISALSIKINNEQRMLSMYQTQKSYLLAQMFI